MNGLKILVTGASGFIGQSLCQALINRGASVRATTSSDEKSGLLKRRLMEWFEQSQLEKALPSSDKSVEVVVVPKPLQSSDSWIEACSGIDAIIHLAGRAHILKESEASPISAFRISNRDTTAALINAAVAKKVKRFVFVSSIGVNGNETFGSPFTEQDDPEPHDPYSISKFEAEQAVLQVAERDNIETVIVRPPLVYGPGVKGNLLSLMKLGSTGLPLPFASVKNLRSLIGVENLADLLILCSVHPKAAGETFVVSDNEDVSTPFIIEQLARGMGRPSRLFSCRESVLLFIASLLGVKKRLAKLCGNLQINSAHVQQLLDWTPLHSPSYGLRRTGECYKKGKRLV